MRKNRHLVSGSRVVGLIIFISLTLFGASVWSSVTRSHQRQAAANRQTFKEEFDSLAERLQPDKVPVWNMTRLVRLIKIDKVENGDLTLTLENGYYKKITGFQVSVGNVGIHTEYMYNPDQMIPPGGTWVLRVPIEPYTDTKGITFMSVHFEDGTGDGDEAAIKLVEEERAGQIAQIRRALALIRRTLRAPNADSVAALDELLSQIRSLPSQGENGRDNFWAGLESGKQRMIAIIDELRQKQDHSTYRAQGFQIQSDTSISSELMKVVEKHERVVSPR
jgi:hypothetical protein